MSFSDILKGNFTAEFSAISIGGMLTAISLAFVLSLFIVFIYRITYAGVNFNRNFAACLIMIAMVTAVVIQVISSNVVLSLGMVGALSIVRFRTAVKEPSDTAFLFWAIADGIICGAGYVTVSVLSTLLLGILFVLVYIVGRKYKANSFMVVVRYDTGCDMEAELSNMPAYKLKNKTINLEVTELIAEMRLGDEEMDKLNQLRLKNGVNEISIMKSVSGSIM